MMGAAEQAAGPSSNPAGPAAAADAAGRCRRSLPAYLLLTITVINRLAATIEAVVMTVTLA